MLLMNISCFVYTPNPQPWARPILIHLKHTYRSYIGCPWTKFHGWAWCRDKNTHARSGIVTGIYQRVSICHHQHLTSISKLSSLLSPFTNAANTNMSIIQVTHIIFASHILLYHSLPSCSIHLSIFQKKITSSTSESLFLHSPST